MQLDKILKSKGTRAEMEEVKLFLLPEGIIICLEIFKENNVKLQTR